MPVARTVWQGTFADITKAKQRLGYRPKVKVEEGIPRFIEWFKSHSQI